VINRLTTVAKYSGKHVGGRLLEADRETAGAGAVRLGEIGGEGIGIFVDQEVHAVLAVDGDRPRLVHEHGGEAHPLEHVVQLAGAPGWRGKLDELETVDTHRVLERGDLHAKIRLGVHGALLR